MVNELKSQKHAKQQAITQAITSLVARAGASNRQVGETPQLKAKSSKLLDLLQLLRRRRQSSANPKQLVERIAELEEYNQTLRKRVVDMQAQIYKLKSSSGVSPLDASLHEELHNLQTDNTHLRSQISKLKEEVQSASKAVNIAWQQGYLAGQLAGQEQAAERKGFTETLAEAAQAATAYGASETGARNTATATATHEAAPPPAEQPYIFESPDYLVDALQLNDPEVLNDPFTAKLLDALGTEVPEVLQPAVQEDNAAQSHAAGEPISQPVTNSAAFSCEPDGMMVEDTQHVNWYMTGNTDSLSHVSQVETLQSASQAPEAHAPQPEPVLEQHVQPQENHHHAEPELASHPETHQDHDPSQDDSSSQFSADELHTLFRNKYVRTDDPQEKHERPASPDPSASGTFPSYKKFVGTNKNTSSDPLPTASRVFPPEIRKACKLLGLNPEEMTRASVSEAWKKEMAKPGVHPDTGGDTEMAIYLNTAKDSLIRWLDDQAPKLGKKFGANAGAREQHKPKKES